MIGSVDNLSATPKAMPKAMQKAIKKARVYLAFFIPLRVVVLEIYIQHILYYIQRFRFDLFSDFAF